MWKLAFLPSVMETTFHYKNDWLGYGNGTWDVVWEARKLPTTWGCPCVAGNLPFLTPTTKGRCCPSACPAPIIMTTFSPAIPFQTVLLNSRGRSKGERECHKILHKYNFNISPSLKGGPAKEAPCGFSGSGFPVDRPLPCRGESQQWQPRPTTVTMWGSRQTQAKK